MDLNLDILVRWLHVIGAAVLLGTGAGIAFFMLMAHRTGDVRIIAHTASIVVLADLLFTATAVIAQPLTGLWLAQQAGWPLMQGWLLLSIILYVVTGLCWLPVVWIQYRLRNLARAALQAGQELPRQYDSLFRIWFVLGFPAFVSVLAIVWLMLARPDINLPF